MNRLNFIYCFGFACIVLLLSGCSSRAVIVNQQIPKGPPPHAPAHGYRLKNQHGLEMRYDAHLGVYIILNYLKHYYWDGKYYRKGKNQWESSKDINKKWKGIAKQKLPKGLQST